MSPREWRPITWVLIGFTVAMAVWFVTTLRSTGALSARDCEDAAEARAVCELEGDAQAVDPGPTAILLLWAGGAGLLAVVWWATNRDIPHRRIWLVVKTVIGVALGGLILVTGIWGYFHDSKESRALAALPDFEAHLSDYTPETTQPSGSDPYTRAGVITLLVPDPGGAENASINGRLYQSLSSDLRAEDPDQVSMVVRTECGWTGHQYMSNIGVSNTYYECECKLVLVDLSTSPPVAVEVNRLFGTGDLPENITGDDDHYRWGCPWHDIAAYLATLPRQ